MSPITFTKEVPDIFKGKHVLKNYTDFINNEYGIVFFPEDRMYGIAYTKKATRHTWHYRFKDASQCMETAQSFLDSLEKRAETRAKAKVDRMKPHTLKVNDILSASWGYDQTNVDFFKVVSTTKNSVRVVEIGQNLVEMTGDMTETVTADPDNVLSTPKLYRVDARYNSICIKNFIVASPWDGKPKYQSHTH